MGAMNKMLEFLITHGQEHRECPTLKHSQYLQYCEKPLSSTDRNALYYMYLPASGKLAKEAEDNGEHCSNKALNWNLLSLLFCLLLI